MGGGLYRGVTRILKGGAQLDNGLVLVCGKAMHGQLCWREGMCPQYLCSIMIIIINFLLKKAGRGAGG